MRDAVPQADAFAQPIRQGPFDRPSVGYIPEGADPPLASFALALLFTTTSLVSLGFLVASVVATTRFAQPIGTLVFYPMLGLSGLFVPIDALPPVLQAVSRLLPLTYAVSLLRGIWHGAPWSAHAGDVTGLVVMFAVFTALSSRLVRWE